MIALAATAAGAGLLATAACYPNCPVFGSVIGTGSRRERSVYLTFDDGPNPGATEPILDTLDRYDVPATFFMVGNHVQRYPELARRVASAGHEIGNHTQSHVKLHLRTPRRIRTELEAAHATIVQTVGITPRSFRAPHGYRNPFVTNVARGLRYRVFGWSFGVWDSDKPGAEVIRQRVRAKLGPGAIVLLHDGDGYDPAGDRRQTAEALPGIIGDARAAGYQFRSLRELPR